MVSGPIEIALFVHDDALQGIASVRGPAIEGVQNGLRPRSIHLEHYAAITVTVGGGPVEVSFTVADHGRPGNPSAGVVRKVVQHGLRAAAAEFVHDAVAVQAAIRGGPVEVTGWVLNHA